MTRFLSAAMAMLAAGLLLGGCSATIDDPLTLSITNNTTLPITLTVNGLSVGLFQPGGSAMPLAAERLPSAPWHVEALTPSGRVLLTLDAKPGDAWHSGPDAEGRSSSSGPSARADLSCGRLDVWVVYPMLEPMPPASFPPGDCAP